MTWKKSWTCVALIFANLLSCVHAINPCCYAVKLWVTDISYFCIYMNRPQNSHRTEGVWESGKVQVCRCKSLSVSKCKSLPMHKCNTTGWTQIILVDMRKVVWEQSGTWLFVFFLVSVKFPGKLRKCWDRKSKFLLGGCNQALKLKAAALWEKNGEISFQKRKENSRPTKIQRIFFIRWKMEKYNFDKSWNGLGKWYM